MGWDILETETVLEPDEPETAEEAYAALVNGVMNHGAKTVTALSLDEEPRGKTGLYEQAVREAGHNPDADHRFIPGRATIKDYLSESLVDIGLVGQEKITEAQHPSMEGGTAYSITDFGRHMQPILAYGVKATSEAERLNELQEALGPTYSSGDGRSPMRRSRILHSIRDDSRNNREIAREHEMDPGQVDNLTTRLDEEGLVDETNIYLEGGHYLQLEDDVSEEDVETVSTYATMTDNVFEILDGSEEPVNAGEIIEEIGTSSARQVIGGLKNQGVISEVPNLRLTQKGEEALEILDNTANAVSRYIQADAETMDEALDAMPDYIVDAWEEYQNNPEQFREEYNKDVWNTSRLNSSSVNALEPEEAQQRVEQIVRRYDEPISVEEVAEEWEEQYPEKRTTKAIQSYLNKNKNVSNEKPDEGYHKLWSLDEEDPEQN